MLSRKTSVIGFMFRAPAMAFAETRLFCTRAPAGVRGDFKVRCYSERLVMGCLDGFLFICPVLAFEPLWSRTRVAAPI